MSSAILDASHIGSVGPTSATVWRHILWKDFRQMWQLIVGIALIQAVLQLLTGLLERLLPTEMSGLSLSAINIALASPALLAIACSGVLIGQERQTGCWTWASSLPVSWRLSLASKVIVWLGSSVASAVLLLGVAAIALSMNHKSLLLVSGQPGMDSWTYWITLVIGVQVFIYCAIASLLIKDTLMAIVVAAFGLFVFHLQVTTFNIGYQTNHEYTMLLAYFAAFVIGSVWLAATYRWRWGVGQSTQISFFTRAARGFVRPQRAAWQSYAVSATQPSEIGMLLQHGIQSSLGLRVVVFFGALLMIVVSSNEPVINLGGIAVFLASCVLGVSVFSGDQTSGRFRFFADRGVNWKKLLISHVAPPALLATVIAFAVIKSSETFGTQEVWVCAIYIPIFIVGMFSSLVFASPIVSITVAITMMIVAIAFSQSAIAVWQLVLPANGVSIAIWFPVSTLIVLVACVRLVPRWLTKDRIDARGIYFGTMLVAALLPCVLGLSLGFLQIPKVTWQGTPLEQIKRIDWDGGPDLMAWDGLPVGEQSSLRLESNWQESLRVSQLKTNIREATHARVQDFSLWFDSQSELLEAIEKSGTMPNLDNSQLTAKLRNMIEGSAVIALMATEQRQKELAIRAWTANHKLLAFCQQPALQAVTMRSAAFVWEIWNTLDNDSLQFLVDTKVLGKLTPVALDLEHAREVLRARATLHRIMSTFGSEPDLSRYSTYITVLPSPSPLRVYPPIRWAYERQEAIALSDQLAVGLPRPGVFRDALDRDYSILIFLEQNFQVRLRELQEPTEQ